MLTNPGFVVAALSQQFSPPCPDWLKVVKELVNYKSDDWLNSFALVFGCNPSHIWQETAENSCLHPCNLTVCNKIDTYRVRMYVIFVMLLVTYLCTEYVRGHYGTTSEIYAY